MAKKMKKKSRYVKKVERVKIDTSSNFKCAWCGINLMERHHIESFSEGGENSAENLILLCPNCHTLEQQGKISAEELSQRKKKLSGEVDRSSGFLALNKEYIFNLGGNTFIDTPNIINHNGENLFRIKVENNNLLISLRIYDKKMNLICWMEDNKWWVENEEIFNFSYSLKAFSVQSKDKGVQICIEIEEDLINVYGSLYLNGYILKFDDEKIEYFNASNPQQLSTFRGNTFDSCGCAFVFDTKP